jgi:hypothetical protein
VLLADSGYGLEPWLMTAFRICHTKEENAFNTLLKKERVIIERYFGQVKRRLPIIKYRGRGGRFGHLSSNDYISTDGSHK